MKIACKRSTYDFEHSHKKRNDSIEGSLDRVLFAEELEFPIILILGHQM